MYAHALASHVEQTLDAPDARAALDARLEAFAAEGGAALGPGDKRGMADLAEAYVRSTVDLLVACDQAAGAAGIAAFAAPVLQTAINYFLSPADHIPDNNGLYGLMDDAYLACRFCARMSEMVRQQRGFALFDTSLDAHSPVIRVLIGEPLASRLDRDIETTLAAVLAQVQMAQLQPIQANPRAGWNDWMRRENEIAVETEIMAIAGGSF